MIVCRKNIDLFEKKMAKKTTAKNNFKKKGKKFFCKTKIRIIIS